MPEQDAGGLFALLRDGTNRVFRLPLNQDTRQAVSTLFQHAAGSLGSRALERIPFDGHCRPDDDEVLVIPDFELPDTVVEALREPLTCEPLNLESADRPPQIRALFTGASDGTRVIFQAFQRTQFLHRGALSLLFNRGLYSTLDTPGINIRSNVDVYFEGGHLLFRSFHTARAVLDLSHHFQEATQEDLTDFASRVQFDNPETFISNADSVVRRRVALIRVGGVLDECSPAQIYAEAQAHAIPIRLRTVDDQEVLVLPDNKQELKAALKFLDEDYYTGPITGRAYVSNSKSRRRS